MNCEYCGKELNDNAQFCTNCGHSTEKISDDPGGAQKTKKGAYVFAVFSLIIVLALMGLGGFQILYRDLHPELYTSASDTASASDIVNIDAALFGNWKCTDPAAADYGDTDHGIEITALLHLAGDGSFTLDYELKNTGITTKSLNVTGKYLTEDGVITFIPDSNPQTADFLKRHGKHPSFPYATEENVITLTYENEKEIYFTRVNH